MPEIPESTELEHLIRTPIQQADDRLQRQLDFVRRRHGERPQDQAQDAFSDAS
jgi:hypothetical protein